MNDRTTQQDRRRGAHARTAGAAWAALALAGCAVFDADEPQVPSRATWTARPALGAQMAPTPKTLATQEPALGAMDGAAVTAAKWVAPGATVAARPEPPSPRAEEPSGAPTAESVDRPPAPAALAAPKPSAGLEAPLRTVAPSSAAPASGAEDAGPSVVSIGFARSSAAPGAESADVLSVLAERGKRAPLVVVKGYARAGGKANLDLARQRAIAVKDELVARGVGDERIRTTYEMQTVAAAQASRVDVKLVGVGAVPLPAQAARRNE
jgi:outer membrane protein OmpA-like peptidoglycan-associated protein